MPDFRGLTNWADVDLPDGEVGLPAEPFIDTPENRRIAAALADLRAVMPESQPFATHNPDCWRWHAACLAARTIATLTGEDHPDATT